MKDDLIKYRSLVESVDNVPEEPPYTVDQSEAIVSDLDFMAQKKRMSSLF